MRPDACTIELGKNNAYELPPQLPQRISVERNPAYASVSGQASLAVDELIVTHTVMLSDFYTPM